MNRPSFQTYNLGCRVNQAEIGQIGQSLIQRGFTPTNTDTPDLVIINTCVVTAKAEKETRKAISHYRKKYPESFLVVAGCAASARDNLKIKLPNADLYIANQNKDDIPKIISQRFALKTVVREHQPNNKYQISGRGLVKIQEGCSRKCTYCIVPYVRGDPTSIPKSEIINQINILVNSGVSEIILTGINLTLYGLDFNPQSNLLLLIKQILRMTKIKKLTLSSIDPAIINDEFTDLVIKENRMSRYLNLSLQSGSETILDKMGRSTSLVKLTNKIKTIQNKILEFTIGADIIVGFPGESEKEFKETVNFMQDLPVPFVHVFPFSKRQGTSAFDKIQKGEWNDLPAKIKKERVNQILEITRKIKEKQAQKLIGQTLECLVIKKLPNGFYETQAVNAWRVLAKGNFKPGELHYLKIIKTYGFSSLQGEALQGDTLTK